MTRIFAVTLGAALLLGSVARAQEGSRPGAGSVLALAVPDRAAALRIRAEARVRLLDALWFLHWRPLDADRPPDVLLEQAIARYDAVLRAMPDDVDATLERARALYEFERTLADGRLETRIDEAIEAYDRVRALDPRRAVGFVAFQLAVLRTRRSEYAEAAEEYARALEARGLAPSLPVHGVSRHEMLLIELSPPATVETILANWAEVTMLSGDAAAATDRYRAALAGAEAGTDSEALSLWGLALAEERAGEHADAIETALRAIDADPSPEVHERAGLVAQHGAFAVLHAPDVFFEPACEIHAYESLGHEALATRASTDEGRAAEWTAARLSARFFLAEGGRDSPYASVATAAEARLSLQLAPRAPTSERRRPQRERLRQQ